MRKALRVITWIIIVLVLAAGAGAVYVRMATDDAAVWHIDPEGAKRTGKPNDYVVGPGGGDKVKRSPVFEMTPDELMAAFHKVAMAQPDVTLLGDSNGFATYVQRTKLIRFPDYISVKAVPVEGGAALHVYSRSRFGYSDRGVNKQRISAWLDKL